MCNFKCRLKKLYSVYRFHLVDAPDAAFVIGVGKYDK